MSGRWVFSPEYSLKECNFLGEGVSIYEVFENKEAKDKGRL